MAITPRALVQGFEMGAKSALGIGAACACVGFVLGITTLTGMGFKFSAFVLDLSGTVAAQAVHVAGPLGWLDLQTLTVLFGLLFTAIACIIMGSGVPTTPTYIILASIVAPALAQLGVPQLATHFFVFYYGVLADVTPPVALAAFAAAGIARSEPMRTGMTAFRLSMGKALVPFAFVYTPALLFVDFSWGSFLVALVGIVVAILGLGAAYTGYCGRPWGGLAFLVLNVLSLSLVFGHPGVTAVAAPAVLLILAGTHAPRAAVPSVQRDVQRLGQPHLAPACAGATLARGCCPSGPVLRPMSSQWRGCGGCGSGGVARPCCHAAAVQSAGLQHHLGRRQPALVQVVESLRPVGQRAAGHPRQVTEHCTVQCRHGGAQVGHAVGVGAQQRDLGQRKLAHVDLAGPVLQPDVHHHTAGLHRSQRGLARDGAADRVDHEVERVVGWRLGCAGRTTAQRACCATDARRPSCTSATSSRSTP
jgi:hypothetical protein